MDAKCPHCGTEYDVESKEMYRYTKCEVCAKGFVIGAQPENMGNTTRPTPTRSNNIVLPDRFAHPNAKSSAQSETSFRNKIRGVFKKKSVLVILGVLCFLLISGLIGTGGYLYWGDNPRLKRGISYYEDGAFDKACNILLPLANKGYAKAQLIIGDCYADGNGFIIDTEEAVKWYRLAADQELPEAQHRMYKCYREGIGIDCNVANAAKWCRRAADAGYEEAMHDMGVMYISGTGVEQNYKSSFKWFRKGAECGHPMCLYKFGICYKYGLGVEKDEDEAMKWQNKAVDKWREMAKNGNTDAMVQIAKLYEEGDVVELDKEEAVNWYRKGADNGNEIAQFKLASCYHRGEGIEEDQEESAKWMKKVAEKTKNGEYQWVMGRYYQEGWGVQKDSVEAVKWFARAAKKGYAEAKYFLAMCYLNGDGVEKDLEKGEDILEEAVQEGNKKAEKLLLSIRRRRAEEEARIAREAREREERIARENSEKREQIEFLSRLEEDILVRKKRINNILKGKDYEEWAGIDDSKILTIDSSISVAEEQPIKKMASTLSEADSLEKINGLVQVSEKELSRLEDRLKAFLHVKEIYDEKELESRKEKCNSCKGTGVIDCSRCKGKGEVVAKEKGACPLCSKTDSYEFGSGFDIKSSKQSGRGKVKIEVTCNYCRGNGEVPTKCGTCNGRGKVTIQEVRKLRNVRSCYSCNGSGRGSSITCPRCHGERSISVWQTCTRCKGNGVVVSGSMVECPVCTGKSKLKCEYCEGRGFTYRPKQSWSEEGEGTVPQT